ncbi:MAG: HAMP domain-containing sensor histidine kinase [Psychrilyobacter sp.]|uniref:sensor histidine kinase n=1 Tax=Psychrilyobacter sp. TaxID=2586924 RepID=UPI003C75F5F1
MKKKYISKDLKKSYFIIVIVILAVFVQITMFSWNHSKGNGKKEVQVVLNFLKEEISSSEELSLREKSEDALGEVPSFSDLSIVMKNDDFYLKKGDVILKNLPTKDEVTMYKFYRYYIYNYTIYDDKNNPIQVTIVKNLDENIEFVIDIFLIFLIIFIFLNLTVLFLYKYFYKNMISQIKKIEEEVNRLDIYGESFKLIESNEDYYEENKNIINATNNMLIRLSDQKNQQMDFIHSASHEMKTPLTVMKGYTGMLERWAIDDGDKGVIKEYVGVISNTVNESAELIEKLLFLVQNDIDLTLETLNLRELVRKIYLNLLIKYPESEIVIEGDREISTDKVLIKLLLFNLIENAIKYGSSKKIEIMISDEFLSISNDGEHIKEENLNRIFDRFYREDKSRNNEIEGHGLGLSIVKVISKKLGFQVEIKNKETVGVISKLYFSN